MASPFFMRLSIRRTYRKRTRVIQKVNKAADNLKFNRSGVRTLPIKNSIVLSVYLISVAVSVRT